MEFTSKSKSKFEVRRLSTKNKIISFRVCCISEVRSVVTKLPRQGGKCQLKMVLNERKAGYEIQKKK